MSGNIDRYGRARTPQNVMPRIPTYHSPSYNTRTAASYNPSFWEKINDFFAGIGDWFQDCYESVEEFFLEKVIPVLVVIAIIGVVIGAIVTWVSDGFWYFVLYVIVALFLGGIVAYASFYALVICVFILRLILLILRYVFTNAISFFITLLVVIGIVIGLSYNTPSKSSKSKTVATVPSYTTYYCSASSLNVRSYASTHAPIIGKLKRGERIQVYEIKNGFAKIQYNNRTGYVSERYITLYSY